MLRKGSICRMSDVASRELRNDTAGLMRRVEAGEVITITVNGKPVAQLTTLQNSRRRWLSGDELAKRLTRCQADPGLRHDHAALAGDTTDDLGPISMRALLPPARPKSARNGWRHEMPSPIWWHFPSMKTLHGCGRGFGSISGRRDAGWGSTTCGSCDRRFARTAGHCSR